MIKAVVQEEMFSFLRKFNQLNGDGFNATLNFNSFQGRIFINIHADDGDASRLNVEDDHDAPSLFEQNVGSKKKSYMKPSRTRRRRRRERQRCSEQTLAETTEEYINLIDESQSDDSAILVPEPCYDTVPQDKSIAAVLPTSLISNKSPPLCADDCQLSKESWIDTHVDEKPGIFPKTQKPVLNYVPTQLETMVYTIAEDLNLRMCRNST